MIQKASGKDDVESHATENDPLLKCSLDQDMSEDDSSSERGGTDHLALRGRCLLMMVAFLYGSLNVSLRMIYETPGPPSASALSSGRGWLAAACFVPLLVGKKNANSGTSEDDKASLAPISMWRAGLELALFNFGAQGFLTLGLLSTESARASFLTQTSVVWTPIISIIFRQRVKWIVWLACGLALAGLILISDNAGVVFSFTPGDLWVLSGALCWSSYLFRLSCIGDSLDEIQLQGVKTFILAILYSIWFIAASIQSDSLLWPGWKNPFVWMLVFYSAAGPGTIVDIIQQIGQSAVSASEANIILSMEPVFTAILGLLLLGEGTTLLEGLGGLLIVLASIISSF